MSKRSLRRRLLSASLLMIGAAALLGACTADPPLPPDTMPPVDNPNARCGYEAAPVPSGVGETITQGPVRAGVGEAALDLPVGTPLSGYTARARLLGGSAPDNRQSPHARAFAPSAGAQSRPIVRALYLQAGSEPLLLIKADLCLAYDRLVFDVEKALASEGLMPARGHVVVATSHSHAAPGTYHGAYHLTLGLDQFEESQYQRLLASLVSAGRAAIKAAAPARLGVGIWDGWDRSDEIYSDRRGEDDGFLGSDGKPVGKHKEQRLLVVRVDDPVGKPLALVHSFPMHGTIADSDNSLISVEASGHVEMALEDRFDTPVMVMHLQGPAGDASPRGDRYGLGHCDDKTAMCSNFARMESIGELAAPRILNLFNGITTSAQATLEVVTRTVYNGRDIKVRDGLSYAPYNPDLEVKSGHDDIFTADGKVRNPITQFNVAAGAGLCGEKSGKLPVAGIGGATGVPYGSCADIGAAVEFIASLLRQPPPAEGVPTCETTRATVTALRIDGVPVKRLDGAGNPVGGIDPSPILLVTLPGEPLSLLADALRTRIAAPAGEGNTFVIGYSQGHVGYLLGVENWLAGGYEPSINLFGPLEGEWLMERAADVAKLALTPQRDDAEAPGAQSPMAGARYDRLIYKPGALAQVPRSPATQAGQVPATLPAKVLVRTLSTPPTKAQPAATLVRVSGRATFVFYGGDPEDDLPEVTLEHETTPGTFTPVTLPSGRKLGSRGRDVILTYTPDPIDAAPGKATSHLWAAEWQAVGWNRSMGLAGALSAPLGQYRFVARGRTDAKTYEVRSQPFSVVAEGAVTVAATRSGGVVSGSANYPVGSGFRLLHLQGASDGDVPVRGLATLSIRSKKDGVTTSTTPNFTDGKFSLDVSSLDASAGLTVSIEDAAKNRGQIDIP